MKFGLVLEGGAMRGLFTAGVIDVFLENNIEFDAAIGVSAGACFGINLKSRQPGRTIRYNKKYCNDPRYCSIRSLIKTGDIYGVDFCYNRIPNELDIFDKDACRENPMKFYTVSTDVVTGTPVYTLLEDGGDKDIQWIRASASMPMVSRVVDIDGGHYLDGGISDSIPLKKFQEMGYEKCVTVLTKPRNYKKSDNHSSFLVRIMHHEYPVLSSVMRNRPKMYNEQLEYIKEQERLGKTIVIAPPEPLPVGRIEHDPDKVQEAYEIGRQAAIEMLDKIKLFLKDKTDS